MSLKRARSSETLKLIECTYTIHGNTAYDFGLVYMLTSFLVTHVYSDTHNIGIIYFEGINFTILSNANINKKILQMGTAYHTQYVKF